MFFSIVFCCHNAFMYFHFFLIYRRNFCIFDRCLAVKSIFIYTTIITFRKFLNIKLANIPVSVCDGLQENSEKIETMLPWFDEKEADVCKIIYLITLCIAIFSHNIWLWLVINSNQWYMRCFSDYYLNMEVLNTGLPLQYSGRMVSD